MLFENKFISMMLFFIVIFNEVLMFLLITNNIKDNIVYDQKLDSNECFYFNKIDYLRNDK